MRVPSSGWSCPPVWLTGGFQLQPGKGTEDEQLHQAMSFGCWPRVREPRVPESKGCVLGSFLLAPLRNYSVTAS